VVVVVVRECLCVVWVLLFLERAVRAMTMDRLDESPDGGGGTGHDDSREEGERGEGRER
jgi:hypothetical protein